MEALDWIIIIRFKFRKMKLINRQLTYSQLQVLVENKILPGNREDSLTLKTTNIEDLLINYITI
jgi:hypothetical protein